MKKLLLLSYPRSGNTFSRYILEHATGLPSSGYEESGLDQTSVSGRELGAQCAAALIVKRHDTTGAIGGEQYRVDPSEYEGVILVLRNPGEVIVRHVGPQKVKALLKKNSLTKEDTKGFSYLFDNLSFFENSKLPKLLIAYEDLVADTEGVYAKMRAFCDELGMLAPNAIPTADFMADIEDHRKKSLTRYGKSQSGGKSGSFHLDALSSGERRKLAKLVDEFCSEECQHMISHYKVEGKSNPLAYWFRRIVIKIRKKLGW